MNYLEFGNALFFARNTKVFNCRRDFNEYFYAITYSDGARLYKNNEYIFNCDKIIGNYILSKGLLYQIVGENLHDCGAASNIFMHRGIYFATCATNKVILNNITFENAICNEKYLLYTANNHLYSINIIGGERFMVMYNFIGGEVIFKKNLFIIKKDDKVYFPFINFKINYINADSRSILHEFIVTQDDFYELHKNYFIMHRDNHLYLADNMFKTARKIEFKERPGKSLSKNNSIFLLCGSNVYIRCPGAELKMLDVRIADIVKTSEYVIGKNRFIFTFYTSSGHKVRTIGRRKLYFIRAPSAGILKYPNIKLFLAFLYFNKIRLSKDLKSYIFRFL
jgi:hypothetical protein